MITDTQKMTSPATGESRNDGLSHADLKSCVDDFLQTTEDARALSERCRDYYDGKQWTAEQIKELRRRKQAPIVNNRIKVKHNGLLGLALARRADPRAYARNNEQDSASAEACTDALRYTAENAMLQNTITAVADNMFCEGYGAAHIVTEALPNGDTEIIVEHIPWDRLFYDTYSRKNDFSDARSKGFVMWGFEADLRDTFPEAPDEVFSTGEDLSSGSGDTFEDRPSEWYSKEGGKKRHLVATHYYKHKGVWYVAIYTGSGFLLEPTEVQYVDEFGRPECPLEMVSAYTDRDNNRYGELAAFLDLQDEINHRRSKALFLLSQRQTYGNRGAVKDAAKAKRELAKPDGHLEVGQGEFGKDFGILPTGDMAQGQFELLQEAKAEIDAQGYNAQLAGERQTGNLSGVAINRLQQAGVNELNILFDALSNFRLRVYRQMWNRIRQFWTQEKWVRVTDDQKAPRYVGFNVELSTKDYLQEIMDDESKPYAMRLGASAKMIQLEQTNPDALLQPIMVKNRPAELDMDIILDESYDSINTSQEQLDAIIQFGAQGQFDIVDLLEISNVPGKRQLIEKIEQRRKEAGGTGEAAVQQLQAQIQELEKQLAMKQQVNEQSLALDAEKIQAEKAKVAIDAHRAETDRMKVQSDAALRAYELERTPPADVVNPATQNPEPQAATPAPAAPPVQIILTKDGVGGMIAEQEAKAAVEKQAEAAAEAEKEAAEMAHEMDMKAQEMAFNAGLVEKIVDAVNNLTEVASKPKEAIIMDPSGKVVRKGVVG